MRNRLTAVFGGKSDRQLTCAGHLEVRRFVLITMGVAADHDRLGPVWYQPRDVGDDDRFAEDDATQDVADGAIGRCPHLLEVELLHPRFIRGEGGAPYA